MYALQLLFVGLAISHLIWFLTYLWGTTVVPPIDDEPNRCFSTARVVLATGCGISLVGFEAFICGLFDVLTAPWLISLMVANTLAAFLSWGLRARPTSLWSAIRNDLRKGFSLPAAIVYLLFLALSTQAVWPQTAGDALGYHLQYAYEWFQAGRITVDPFMKLPYYASNWLLEYVWMFALGLTRYVGFLNWLTGVLEGLGIYAIVSICDSAWQAERTKVAQRAVSVIYVLSAFSLAASPTFLRWSDTGLIDVPIGLFFTLTGLALSYWIIKRDQASLWAVAISSGFLIGMKLSFFLLLPMSVAIAAIVGFLLRLPRRRVLGFTALMLAIALPWYARNLLLVGDPIPPVLNLALRGHDPIYSAKDWQGNAQDLATDRSLKGAVTFPYREFARSETRDVREYGTSAAVLGLYLIVVVSVLLVTGRRKTPHEIAILALLFLTLTGAAYVFVTSSLGRYTLLFYGVMAAANALALLYLTSKRPGYVALALVASALALFPSPTAHDALLSYWRINYSDLLSLKSDESYLEAQLPAYKAFKPLFSDSELIGAGKKRVLLFGANLGYYCRLRGVATIGDWVGPGRFQRLIAAIDNGVVNQYVREYNVGAVVINTDFLLSENELAYLEEQLRWDGFYELTPRAKGLVVFAPRNAYEQRVLQRL